MQKKSKEQLILESTLIDVRSNSSGLNEALYDDNHMRNTQIMGAQLAFASMLAVPMPIIKAIAVIRRKLRFEKNLCHKEKDLVRREQCNLKTTLNYLKALKGKYSSSDCDKNCKEKIKLEIEKTSNKVREIDEELRLQSKASSTGSKIKRFLA